MSQTVRAVAVALRGAAAKFNSPVFLYVEREAEIRYEAADPVNDAYDEANAGRDWALESWEILARAAIEAMCDITDARVLK